MKTLTVFILTFLLGSLSFGQAHIKKTPMTVHRLVKSLDQNLAEKMPKEVRKMPLKDFKVYKNLISFKMDKIFFQIKLVGTEKVALTINAKEFSKLEVSGLKNFEKAFKTKFNIRYRQFSLLNVLVNHAFADIDFNEIPYEETPVIWTPTESDTSEDDLAENNPVEHTVINGVAAASVVGRDDFRQAHYEASRFSNLRTLMSFVSGPSIRNIFTAMGFLTNSLNYYMNNLGPAQPWLDGGEDPTLVPRPTRSYSSLKSH